MKRVWLVPINPQRADVIDLRGDCRRQMPESPCCHVFRQLGRIRGKAADGMEIVHLNVNYCAVCGRKIECPRLA